MQIATEFELWANKWCFEMSGNEEKELIEVYDEQTRTA